MRAARAFLVLASILLLQACSGRDVARVAPLPFAPSPGAGANLVVVLPDFLKSLARRPAYISPNARSVAVSVTPDPGSIYGPGLVCTNVIAGTSVYSFAVPAPIGRVTVLITANNGPCTSSGGIGTSPTGAVLAQAGPVSGTIVAGQANNFNSAAFFNTTPVSLGVAFDQSSASFTASLSSTPNVTTFEIDPASVVMALPATLSLKDVFGNALVSPDGNGNNVALASPITIALSDTSVNAQPGTLKLAYVGGTGTLLSGPSATAGNPPIATITITSAPPLGSKLAVLYNGATQSTFQSATLSATYGNSTIATIPIGNQPVVSTLPFVYNLPAPLAIAVLPASTIAVTNGSQIVANVAGSPLGAGSSALAAVSYSALAYTLPGGSAKAALYAADSGCVNCNPTSGGIYALVAAGATMTAADVNGVAPTALTYPNNPFLNSVGGGVPVGPTGIAAITPAQGGAATFGSLLVAANNSIFRVDLTASTASTGLVNLIAGSGQGGLAGASYVDSGTGRSARFNFGTARFIGLAVDPTGGTLYVADPGNLAVRAVSLTGTNAVSTVAQLPQAPVGIAVDGTSGVPYVTAANGNIFRLIRGNAFVFAGQGVTNRGSIDGFGTTSYPVQFVAGNSASASAGGGVAPQFAGLGLSANSNTAIGGNPPLATFATPAGIAWDPVTTFFYVVDNGSQTVRRVL